MRHEDEVYALTESGQAIHSNIVRCYNEGFETDEIANFLGLTELEVKILLILGENND